MNVRTKRRSRSGEGDDVRRLTGLAPWRFEPWTIALSACGVVAVGLAAVTARAPSPVVGPLAVRPTRARRADAQESYTLAQGVIAEPGRHRLYVTTVDAGVEAVDYARFSVIWTSHAAQAPVFVHGDQLIALGSARPPVLRLVFLDVVTGKVLDSLPPTSLPGNVDPMVGLQPLAWFGIEGRAQGDTALVTWTWGSRIPPGRPPERSAVQPIPLLGPPWQARTWWGFPQLTGTVAIDLVSRGATPREGVPGRDSLLTHGPGAAYELGPFLLVRDTVVVSKRPVASGDKQIVLRRTKEGTRLADLVLGVERVGHLGELEVEVSADAHHLVLERLVDRGAAQREELTVYSTQSGRRLGQVDVRSLRSAFLVAGNRVLYANSLEADVEVVDLATGRVWFRRPVGALRYVPFTGAAPGGALP